MEQQHLHPVLLTIDGVGALTPVAFCERPFYSIHEAIKLMPAEGHLSLITAPDRTFGQRSLLPVSRCEGVCLREKRLLSARGRWSCRNLGVLSSFVSRGGGRTTGTSQVFTI